MPKGVRGASVKTEQIFKDFLETLEKDENDEYLGYLIQFITEILGGTMSLAKDGYAPVVGLTLYARQHGGDQFEIIFRPHMSSNFEVYQKLKLSDFNQGLKDSIYKYATEVWGMLPSDERNDARDSVQAASDFKIQWGHLNETTED